jgi:hypothetical protein
MLEWITAADMENLLKNDVSGSYKRMWMSVAGAAAIVIVPLASELPEPWQLLRLQRLYGFYRR